MQVIVAGPKDSDRWQSFVNQHQMCFNYHRWPWKHVIEKQFRWQFFFLMAEKNGEVKGFLPLFGPKTRFFGNVFFSFPFFIKVDFGLGTKKARARSLPRAPP